MILSYDQVKCDLDALPKGYKTAQVDALIKKYIKEKVDTSPLREHVLEHLDIHRIYFYVPLKQIKSVRERMEFIHNNLLFYKWQHTDELISFVADLDFDVALKHAKEYIKSSDPFIRRWGYVMFISRLGRGRAEKLLPLMKNDDHYYVQMGEAWLLAELAIFEPEYVYEWLSKCELKYNVTGKAVQKICDSFRVSDEWKAKFKTLRPHLKEIL